MPDSERSGRIVFAVPEEPHAYMTRLRGASNGGSHMQYWFGERGSAVGTPSARRWVANVFRVTTRCFSLTKHRWPMSGSGCSPGEPPTWISTNNVEEATKLCRRARVEGTTSIPSHSLTRGRRQTFTTATNQRDAGQRGRAMLTRGACNSAEHARLSAQPPSPSALRPSSSATPRTGRSLVCPFVS